MMQTPASLDEWAAPLAALAASLHHHTKPVVEWDIPGIRVAISKARHRGTPAEVTDALLYLARKRDLRSPAILADDGAHWGTPTTIPSARQARCDEDGHEFELAPPYCRICRSEALADGTDVYDATKLTEHQAARNIAHAAHIRTLTREPDPRERAAGKTREED